jgi:redox-sensitive bicupin YhaK (pirin superfamily)
MATGAKLALPAGLGERAIYPISGRLRIANEHAEPGEMLVLADGREVTLEAEEPSRLMALGGAALDRKRHIWWNFVSSREERIEQGKRDWREGRFDTVPGETEFIPLPEE